MFFTTHPTHITIAFIRKLFESSLSPFAQLFSFKEIWINLLYVLIEVFVLQTSDRDVEVGVHYRDLIALIRAYHKRLNVVVVGQEAINPSLDKYIGDECGKMIGRDLLIFEQ